MKFNFCESTDAPYPNPIRQLVRQGEILPASIPNNASSWVSHRHNNVGLQTGSDAVFENGELMLTGKLRYRPLIARFDKKR